MDMVEKERRTAFLRIMSKTRWCKPGKRSWQRTWQQARQGITWVCSMQLILFNLQHPQMRRPPLQRGGQLVSRLQSLTICACSYALAPALAAVALMTPCQA